MKYLVITRYYYNRDIRKLDKAFGAGSYLFRKANKVDIDELILYLEKNENNRLVFLHKCDIIMHQMVNDENRDRIINFKEWSKE